MHIRNIYHKGAIVKCLLYAMIAFVVGFAGYIAYSAFIGTQNQSKAFAAWQEIGVRSEVCDCVIRLLPTQPQGGSGIQGDPYIVDNSRVDMVVGINGAATFTVTDQYGDVLFSYNKITQNYEEVPFQMNLSHGVGTYKVFVDMISGTNLSHDVWLEYKALNEIEPPNTGHIYLAGYAFSMDGALETGGFSFLIVLTIMLVIVYVAYRRRESEAKKARADKVRGRIPNSVAKRKQSKSK